MAWNAKNSSNKGIVKPGSVNKARKSRCCFTTSAKSETSQRAELGKRLESESQQRRERVECIIIQSMERMTSAHTTDTDTLEDGRR